MRCCAIRTCLRAIPRRAPSVEVDLPNGGSLSYNLFSQLCNGERRRGSTVEQLICNQWVAGSIPVAGSIKTAGQRIKPLTFSIFRVQAGGI